LQYIAYTFTSHNKSKIIPKDGLPAIPRESAKGRRHGKYAKGEEAKGDKLETRACQIFKTFDFIAIFELVMFFSSVCDHAAT